MGFKGEFSPEHVEAVNRSVKKAFEERPSIFMAQIDRERRRKKEGVQDTNNGHGA